MHIIEIRSTAIREKPIRIKATGEVSTMYSQQAYIHGLLVDGFLSDEAVPSSVTLESKQAAYPVGFYAIGDESFYLDSRNFNKYSVGRWKLVPLGQWMTASQKQIQSVLPSAVRAAA